MVTVGNRPYDNMGKSWIIVTILRWKARVRLAVCLDCLSSPILILDSLRCGYLSIGCYVPICCDGMLQTELYHLYFQVLRPISLLCANSLRQVLNQISEIGPPILHARAFKCQTSTLYDEFSTAGCSLNATLPKFLALAVCLM